MSHPKANVDPRELEKFGNLAHLWWDPTSEFKPLHAINPLRLGWIETHVELSGKRVLDVGCGGGILSESMAARGANVLGIDLSEQALGVAELHGIETGASAQYEMISTEDLAQREPQAFDVITCMEMLEHVPDPSAVIQACAKLVKSGGHVFFSTINRNLKAYVLAVIGAEYILKLIPRGTHDYARFITPSELARFARSAELTVESVTGLVYNPVTQQYRLAGDTDVNYMVATRRATLSS
jgi:2-polyprenyl-6-hydroxyphenyl methylase / 3-demethylubiquinone-9 3-methyltransferase